MILRIRFANVAEKYFALATAGMTLLALLLSVGLFSTGALTGRPQLIDEWLGLTLMAWGLSMILLGGFYGVVRTQQVRWIPIGLVCALVWGAYGLDGLPALIHALRAGGLHIGCDRTAIALGLDHVPGATGAPRAQAR